MTKSRLGRDTGNQWTVWKELQERLNIAGIEVLEARIGYPLMLEIAAVMLKRQQAEAIVAANTKLLRATGNGRWCLDSIGQ